MPKQTKEMEKDLNFEDKLWQAADKLRGSMDASEYKHIVLGLIFLKYISASFEKRREFLIGSTQDETSEYFVPTEPIREVIIEDKNQYLGQGIFYIPPKARWSHLLQNANSPQIAKLINGAMELIERENKQLKGVLPKIYIEYTRIRNLEPRILGELINLFDKIPVEDREKDILGRIYEYFIGQFASAEGKRGGEFYTPRCLVKLLVEILEPYENCRIFDPACGSGGMLVQSKRFLEIHDEDPSKISFCGQEKNFTTWRLCKMNLAIRGILARIEQGDSYHDDKFPDLRTDFALSNPPFNDSDWGKDRIKNDPRIKYGLPPKNNANFMWIQHFIYHLAPTGMAGFVMANGALAVSGKQGKIRKKIIEDDLVDVIVACPPKLFYNVSLPVSLWFITKDKRDKRFRRRMGETLFIDARELYEPISRRQYTFTDEHIQKIANTIRAWQAEKGVGKYKDIPGFCKAVTLKDIEKEGYVLTPGRYVGIKPPEDDGIPLEEKMKKLTDELKQYFEESKKLEKEIKKNLKRLNF